MEVDDRHLREILLNLHSRLGNTDRERLHFYLQNDVPRILADDSSLSGTLKLMQSLFDQDKINENDFTFLIDAFGKIQCFDAVRLLKEHQRRMGLSGWSQSTLSLASMMPSLIREIFDEDEDDEDKYPTESFPFKTIKYNQIEMTRYPNININDDEKTGSNYPMKMIEDKEALVPKSKDGSWISTLPKKYIFFAYFLFLLVSAVLIFVVVEKIQRIHNLEQTLQIKQESVIKNPNGHKETMKTPMDLHLKNNTNNQSMNETSSSINQNYLQSINQLNNLLAEKNQMIDRYDKLLIESNQQQNITAKQWTNLLSKKNAAIEQLNQTNIELEKQRSILPIKVGQKFGGLGDGGPLQSFDDSTSPNFTYAHYLSGLTVFYKYDYPWCQFIYRSAYDNQSVVLSRIRGNYGSSIDSTHTYQLDADERVDEATVIFTNHVFGDPDKEHFKTVIIKALQFRTTKGRFIPPDFPPFDGDIRSERFPGYTLGYVIGSSALAIDRLQFVWYRTKK